MHAGLALGGAGGGGLAHLLIRLFIWHLIWRLGLLIWRVPAVGPELVVVIVLALVALAILRSRRGRGWPGPGRGPRNPFRDRTGDQAGPRDW
ncbi:MAG: hypothetical protein ACLP5E_14240 [Streptosporangiaceae bacterium]|jgi:hypothetical protein